ncbi:MAG: PDZ domain-containing protein [Tepidisphaera sp.]
MNPRRAAFALLMTVAAGARAQPKDKPSEPTPSQPGERAPASKPAKPAEGTTDPVALANDTMRAIAARDWPKAEALLQKQVELGQGRFVPYYNLACVKAVQGQKDAAVEWLLRAIERGFSDIRQIRRDSYLASIRQEPGFRAIVDNWPKFLEKRIERDVAELRETIDQKLDERRDPALRLVYLTASSESTTKQVREEIERVAEWCENGIFKGLMTDAASAEDAWVSIVVPTRESFLRWSLIEYGPAANSGFSMIGGQYSHDEKRLISMDSGSSLRHEFFHVLHWRDMGRRGQIHPIYIQEGLAAVVEDYDLVPDEAKPGSKKVVMVGSWRTNVAKRRERRGSLITIDTLAGLTHEKFMGEQPLAKYACARTLFLWLDQQGKLVEWYKHYTENYDKDPTGLKSFEAVLGADIPELNKRWKAWIRAFPEVPEEILSGMASLGVQIEAQGGDGVAVFAISVPPGHRGRRPEILKGEEGELRVGDIIRSINGKPTRDMAELVRVLSGFDPGEIVTVEVRRGRAVVDVKIKLQKK